MWNHSNNATMVPTTNVIWLLFFNLELREKSGYSREIIAIDLRL